MRANEFITEAVRQRLDPKCWTGKKIGNPKTKVKGGVRVNNCVPAESIAEDTDQKCPPATQDIALNLKNRQKAIDEYGYGPLNPDMPNAEFWMQKVDEWNLDSADEAKQACAATVLLLMCVNRPWTVLHRALTANRPRTQPV